MLRLNFQHSHVCSCHVEIRTKTGSFLSCKKTSWKNVHFLCSCSISCWRKIVLCKIKPLQNKSCTCSRCTTLTSVLMDQRGRVLAAELPKPNMLLSELQGGELNFCCVNILVGFFAARQLYI